MGTKSSKQENQTEKKSSPPIDIRPEANPEDGRDFNVTLPNGTNELCRVYSTQTAGEFKLECLKNQDARPEAIEVVLIDSNLKEMVLNDNEDLKEKLEISQHILLRTKGPTADNQALQNAIHYR